MNQEKLGLHLLVVVLFERSVLDDVILGLTSLSGGRVTIVDGISGAHNLSHSIPMFAEFIGTEGKQYCKVLMTCVSGADAVDRLLDALAEANVDFTGENLGEMYNIPLTHAILLEE
ncbi:hypothetical protein ACFL47_02480 [Candidatus Latescibacterota bacterium]